MGEEWGWENRWRGIWGVRWALPPREVFGWKTRLPLSIPGGEIASAYFLSSFCRDEREQRRGGMYCVEGRRGR